MPISFLILTYNSSSYIYSLLDSLFENVGEKIKNGSYELVIFDNASTDNTTDTISTYFKEELSSLQNIQIIKSKKNHGYAKGINLAAKESKGDILIVINPDAELIESDFGKVISEFEKNKSLAIAGLRLVDRMGRNEKTAGRFYNPFTFLLYALGFEKLLPLRFAPEKSEKVDYVSGGFVAFKREIFEKLGGYDEDYFMYVEDMDICYRAKKAGYTTQYLPVASIRHEGQGSSNRTFAIVNIFKGLQLFYTKHSSLFMLQYVKNLLSLKAALIIFIGAIAGKKELVSAYSQALKTIV